MREHRGPRPGTRHQSTARLLYTWCEKLEPLERGEGPPANSREASLRKEVSRLQRVLAEKILEVDFSQRCFAHRRGATPAERQLWRAGIYDQIRVLMSRQGGFRIERMCQLAQVSRASFNRSFVEHHPEKEHMEVRSTIQQIALEHRRRYGYRRISAELRRRGLPVNHKRVLRLMREDNLLAVQPRAFVVATESDHRLDVYLNLASRMTLTGMNQLWVADITYIRLHAEFVYLAVLLDAFSRKVVGWALDQTLATRLPLETLRHAITTRPPPPGVVHHSDCGVQYLSRDYVQVLREH